MDSKGNIYVVGNIPGGGTWMRSLKEDGTMNWQLYGKIWVSNAAPDLKTDGSDVYDHNALYKMDYNQHGPGKEVQNDFPYAVTVNPWTRSDDPRIQTSGKIDDHYKFTFFVPREIRTCQSKKVLVTSGMFGGQLGVYTQNGLIWEAKTFANITNNDWPWAETVDANCNLWLVYYDGRVRQYPFTGFDAAGNPAYSNAVVYPKINDFNEIMRVSYDTESDTLYLSGFTSDHSRVGGWGDAGPVFKRYPHLKQSQTADLTINLPYKYVKNADGSDNNQDSRYIKDWSVAGDYLFATFVSKNDQTNLQGSPVVFSLKNGSRVMNFQTKAPIVDNDAGWVDVQGGIHAMRSSNGEYRVFLEDDWKNKFLLFRWCSTGSCSNPSSLTSSATVRPVPDPSATSTTNATHP